jgi:hypothetical protein
MGEVFTKSLGETSGQIETVVQVEVAFLLYSIHVIWLGAQCRVARAVLTSRLYSLQMPCYLF